MKIIKTYLKHFDMLLLSQISDRTSKNLSYWSNYLFIKLLSILLPIGIIIAIPSAIISFKSNMLLLGIIDLLSVILLLFSCFSYKPSLQIKKWIFIIWLYSLAILLIISLGMAGPALIYLLGISTIIVLVLNAKIAYLSLAVNFLIIIIYNFILKFNPDLVESIWNIPLAPRLIVFANFLFLNSFIIYAISSLVSGLNSTLMKSRELQSKAQESMRLKASFLANMNHEIRTPMNGILGLTQLLENIDPKDEKFSTFQKLIRKSCYRMLDTVDNILEISQIDAGKFILETKEIILYDILNPLHDSFKTQISELGLVFADTSCHLYLWSLFLCTASVMYY